MAMPPNWATGRAGEQGKDTPASKPFKGRMGDEVRPPLKHLINANSMPTTTCCCKTPRSSGPVHAAPDRCIFRCVTKR